MFATNLLFEQCQSAPQGPGPDKDPSGIDEGKHIPDENAGPVHDAIYLDRGRIFPENFSIKRP